MLLLLRLFKSFAAPPRLPVVTDTVKFAYQDLLRFGLVSVAVIACLCLNAVLLFGRDVEAFGKFASLFAQLFSDAFRRLGLGSHGYLMLLMKLWFTVCHVHGALCYHSAQYALGHYSGQLHGCKKSLSFCSILDGSVSCD